MSTSIRTQSSMTGNNRILAGLPRKNKIEPSSVSDKVVKKPKYHNFYDNPEHNVVILSKDGVRFKASRYQLVKASQFFKDLLDLPTPDKDNEPDQREPIPLDFNSKTITLFLDLISVSQPYPPKIVLEEAKSLMEIIELTMSDNLLSYALSSLKQAGSKQPLELLVIASNRNDIKLAKFALSKITPSHIQSYIGTKTHITTKEGIIKLHQYLNRLSISFRLEILGKIMIPGEIRENRYTNLRPGILFTDDWTSIAEDINPEQYTEGTRNQDNLGSDSEDEDGGSDSGEDDDSDNSSIVQL